MQMRPRGTITPEDAVKIMRRAGVSTTRETLCKGIQQGQYNAFASCIHTGKQWRYYIYAARLYDWLKTIDPYFEEVTA